MLKGGSCQVFEFAILAASIIIEVIWREEPAIYNTHSGYATGLHEMHKMPVTEVKLFGRFMGRQHPIEVL